MLLNHSKLKNKEIQQVLDTKTDLFIKDMYGIVSAGGRGIRLRPLTLQRPKPLIEVGIFKQPLLYWSILPMILGGVSHFIVGVRYGARKIQKKFGKGRELSKRFGRKITINYVEEPEPLGRAGFVKYGIKEGIIDTTRPAIIFNASDILKLNLHDLVRHYLWLDIFHGCEVVQVYTSGFNVRYGIGTIERSSFRVINFVEKPLLPDLASTACYLIYGRLKDFKNIKKIPSNPEDELIYKWLKEKIIGAYIIPPENFISIKFENDLEKIDRMDLEKQIRVIYNEKNW